MKIIVYEIQNTWKISVSENCNLLSSGQFVVYCLVSLLHVLLYDSTAVFFSFFFLSCIFYAVCQCSKDFNFTFPFSYQFLFVSSLNFYSGYFSSFQTCVSSQQNFLFWLLFQLSNLCIITTIFLKSTNLQISQGSFHTILLSVMSCFLILL